MIKKRTSFESHRLQTKSRADEMMTCLSLGAADELQVPDNFAAAAALL
jgi:hypothetical protein